jgi:PEGA domain
MRLHQKILPGLVASLVAISQAPCSWAAQPRSAQNAQNAPKAKVDLSSAKRHYDSGQSKFREGDYAGALTDFQIANDIKATPEAERYVGRCLDQLGRLRAAVEWYDRFLSHVPARMAIHGERIRRRDAEIKAMPGRLHVESNPPGASISVDGNPQSAATPVDVELAPGVHRVRLVGRGRTAAERSVDVAFASTQTVSVDLGTEPALGSSRDVRAAAVRPAERPASIERASPGDGPIDANRGSVADRRASAEDRSVDEDTAADDASPSDETPPPQQGPLIPLRAYLTGGVAVVAAGVGTAFGIAALNDKKEFDSNPTTQNADARSQHALIADIALGAAVASGVATAVLLLENDRSVPPRDGSPKRASVKVGAARETKAVTMVPTPIVGPHGAGAGLLVQF